MQNAGECLWRAVAAWIGLNRSRLADADRGLGSSSVRSGLGEAGVGRGNEGAFVQFGTEVGRVSLVAVKHEPVSRCLVP